MNYPKLVPGWTCTTPISVVIEGEGLTEEGAPIQKLSLNAKCNYQDGGKRTFKSQEKVTVVNATALFDGDIAPSLANITTGYATVHGEKRAIIQGRKNRNPDGTVNYTELWLD